MLKRVAQLPASRMNVDELSSPAREYVYIFDRQGRLLVHDAVSLWKSPHAAPQPIGAVSRLADIVGKDTAARLIERLIDGAALSPTLLSLHGPHLELDPFELEARRLDGPAGPQLLLIVRRTVANDGLGRDPLTGLADRRAIAVQYAAWQQEATESPLKCVLLFVDLDQFKEINDQYGHAAGDAVLVELARRWTAAVRDDDLVARYGGDEFVILLKNVPTAEDAQSIIERLQQATLEPMALINALAVPLSATIGAVVDDGSNLSIEELIATADREMYALKRQRAK